MENYISLYLRGNLPINKSVSFYAFGGVTNFNYKATSPLSPAVSVDKSGFSYGVGFNFKLSGKGSIGFEYVDLHNKNAVDITGFNLQYQYSF